VTWSRVKPRQKVHGHEHAKARAAWASGHQPWHRCVRCGKPLGAMGPHLHLDHDDRDKSVYLGFSHAACNLAAAGRLGRARQKAARNGQSQGPSTQVRL
jgi:hypothetical protein